MLVVLARESLKSEWRYLFTVDLKNYTSSIIDVLQCVPSKWVEIHVSFVEYHNLKSWLDLINK